MIEKNLKVQKQVVYWQTLTRIFCQDDSNNNLTKLASHILNKENSEENLPEILLDNRVSMDNISQRYPEFKESFAKIIPGNEPSNSRDRTNSKNGVSNALLINKLFYNIFGKLASGAVTAGEYSDWCNDVTYLEIAFDLEPGVLRGRNEHEMSRDIKAMEEDIIKRIYLREILNDNDLAAKLTPSISLIDQLLRDKGNLSDTALKNAKRLIKKYVDEVAKILKTQVEQTVTGKTDRSVAPKKCYQNLDLNRTIWKNLQNWNQHEQKLYVDQLYYKRTARKTLPQNIITVVDQSGSMVDSMVNCSILASIFSTMKNVKVSLIAYDTRAFDLSSWIGDPFEILMRTQLGGGTDGTVAVELVKSKIAAPKDTIIVWISDFYEYRQQELFNMFKSFKESGIKFVPVGSVSSSGYQSVNSWFKNRFKQLGCPVISGSIKKLIIELKNFLT